MNVLILGGTGVISRAIVQRLLDSDHDVTLFNRGNRTLAFQKEVRQITGDRLDRGRFSSSIPKRAL